MKTILHPAEFVPAQVIRGREWRSDTTILGLPLLHIAYGRDGLGRRLTARGLIAIGQYAVGGICISQFGRGVVCLSQFSLAVVSVSQFGLSALGLAQFGIFYDGLAQFALRLRDLF